MDLRARLKNKAMWVAIFSFIALLGKTYGLYEVPANFDTLVSLALGILTTLGILIDPTTPGVLDNKKEEQK